MYRQRSRRCGAVMVTISICLRLCMMLGLDTRAAALLSQAVDRTELFRWVLFLETGQALPAGQQADPPPVLVLQIMDAEPAEAPLQQVPIEVQTAAAPILPTAPADADQITVGGACTYPVDTAALLDRPSALDFSGEGPQILIVHTHGSEAYTPEAGFEYQPTAAYRTLDTDRSVVAVGDALARALEANGIAVLHDRSINDYPSYNDSYAVALEKIEDWMAAYPGIQMVLDLHRDAVGSENGQAIALSSRQNGRAAAQLMLVVGTDQGGLSHPNWQENLANALKLQSVLQGQYPGLCRKLDLRTERFNQHAAPGSLLIEVGTNGNTLQQALHSAALLGDGLARMIHALEANNGTLCG